MRIISGFKDYYDSAQSFGVDPNLLYMRKQEQFEYEVGFTFKDREKAGFPLPLNEALGVVLQHVRQLPSVLCPNVRYGWETLECPVTVKLIGFCGSLYPALEMAETVMYSTEHLASDLTEDCLQQFDLDRKELEKILNQNYSKASHWYYRPLPLTHGVWCEAVSEFVDKRFDDIFIKLGVPVFKLEYAASNKHKKGIDRVRCVLNPVLRTELFQKIKGPAAAFQELSMYLGNQLARQPDPVSPVSDEIMRDEKGFDEWSFRRHKEEDAKYRKKKQNDPPG